MPLKNAEHRGTEANGSASLEYCKFCYHEGKFLDEGISLKDKINKNIDIATKMGLSRAEATEMANSVIPGLKRWSGKG